MSDEPTMAEEIELAVRRSEAAQHRDLVRALTVMVLELAAIIHRRHPEDLEHVLRTARLEMQALQLRRRRPRFRGALAMWRQAVALLELVPGPARQLWRSDGT